MVKNIEKNKEFSCFIVIFGTQSSMRKIMKRFRNGNLYIILSLLVLITSSCSSSRRLQNKEYEILSQKIGVRLDAHDNIRLYRECASWLGSPYKYGGNTPRGTDCSGMVSHIYDKIYNIKLHRSSEGIMKMNCRKISRSRLREGDLVFFKTKSKNNKINHVGIYLKDGFFIHASTSKGVIISNLDDNYYRRTWVCGGKVKGR